MATVSRPLTIEEKMNLQRRLRDEGYYKGAIDGRLGELSASAIEAAKRKEDVATLDQLLERWNILETVNNVEVKSAWASKINWTMFFGVAFNLLALFGIPIDDQTKVQIMALGSSVIYLAGWVQRTFFTQSLTAASAKKL